MDEPEWLSTNRSGYWHHTPCGEFVRLRMGLPEQHTCRPKKKKEIGELDARYEERRKMSNYANGKCLECGSTVHGPARGQHSNFHANYIHRSEVKDGFLAMSIPSWCDMGHHAFKKGAPGSQSIDVMRTNDEGEEERVRMDMCADHAFPTESPTPPSAAREIEQAYDDSVAIQKKYEKLMKERLSTPMNSLSNVPHHNED